MEAIYYAGEIAVVKCDLTVLWSINKWWNSFYLDKERILQLPQKFETSFFL